MSEFGEPWEHHPSKGVMTHSECGPIEMMSMDAPDLVRLADRLVACVNALAGCRPEKLGALLEAAIYAADTGSDWCDTKRRLRIALAAFRPAPEEPTPPLGGLDLRKRDTTVYGPGPSIPDMFIGTEPMWKPEEPTP